MSLVCSEVLDAEELLAREQGRPLVGLFTWSKLILMLPTLVAPTGTMLKKPYRHLPSTVGHDGLSIDLSVAGIGATYRLHVHSAQTDP